MADKDVGWESLYPTSFHSGECLRGLGESVRGVQFVEEICFFFSIDEDAQPRER